MALCRVCLCQYIQNVSQYCLTLYTSTYVTHNQGIDVMSFMSCVFFVFELFIAECIIPYRFYVCDS